MDMMNGFVSFGCFSVLSSVAGNPLSLFEYTPHIWSLSMFRRSDGRV
jgi:hypothetical protein